MEGQQRWRGLGAVTMLVRLVAASLGCRTVTQVGQIEEEIYVFARP